MSRTGESSGQTSQQRSRALSVALVAMPFISVWRPSLQIGLLSAVARSEGFAAETFHLSLEFAAEIGGELYQNLCQQRTMLVGDWLFSRAAFGEATPDPDCQFLAKTNTSLDPDKLREVRLNAVPAYLDRMMSTIAWERFDVVGFTSTFGQNVASFALAQRIKEDHSQLLTLFGGANFDGEMGEELVRSIHAIDYAINGEADHVFPEFLQAVAESTDPAEVPGVMCRQQGDLRLSGPRPPFSELDALPVPDYDEYFERAERLKLIPRGGKRNIELPFESARGCWWGQKHHCTFCGLNGATMAYRAKSANRVFAELAALSNRYRSSQFVAVDNILDMSYLKEFFPLLKERQLDYKIFYETKANLKKEHLRLLSEAGVERLQPGIESLSTRVLGLMRKGVTAIQNVNVLRWARYYNIEAAWNLIWGFPGESEADCADQQTLIPHLSHLEPPHGTGRIWMERFSPLFWDRASFPMRAIQPAESYAFVYPRSIDLEKVAYFFDYQLENTLPDSAYQKIAQLAETWAESWQKGVRPSLTYLRSPGLVEIEDARDRIEILTYSLEGPLAEIYRAFSDRPISAAGAKARFRWQWPIGEIEGALDEFCGKGLAMRDGDLFLSLALPAAQGQ